MDPPEDPVRALRAELSASGGDYVLYSRLPDTLGRVRFIGTFQGREVVWDMRVYTLARHEAEHGRIPVARDFRLRGLILVEPEADGLMPVEVALDVPEIDETVVRKTIVMVRNYRLLRLGLHTWGEQVGA